MASRRPGGCDRRTCRRAPRTPSNSRRRRRRRCRGRTACRGLPRAAARRATMPARPFAPAHSRERPPRQRPANRRWCRSGARHSHQRRRAVARATCRPCPPPVAEREALFETAPIGLGADRKPQPGGAGFEICVADRACHFSPLRFLGSFWGVSVDERQCTTADVNGKKHREFRHNLRSLEVRQRTGIDPLTAKTGVRIPLGSATSVPIDAPPLCVFNGLCATCLIVWCIVWCSIAPRVSLPVGAFWVTTRRSQPGHSIPGRKRDQRGSLVGLVLAAVRALRT